MPASTTPRFWRPDDVWAFPDDGVRRECIGGELLVTPSPSYEHQSVLAELLAEISNWLRTQRAGRVLTSPADVRLTPDSVVQPDLFVFAGRNALIAGELKLAAEIPSPSTARHDRGLKRRFYQVQHVDEYWVVDLDARLVERWRPDESRPEIVSDTLRWLPAGACEPLCIDLPSLFARALEE